MRNRLFAILSAGALLVAPSSAPAAPAEVQIDVSGISAYAAVSPDTINSLNGIVEYGSTYRFTISFKSSVRLAGAIFPFIIYSPDGSLTQTSVDTIYMSPAWASPIKFWTLGGGSLGVDSMTEILPSKFSTSGIANIAKQGEGFLSDTLIEILFLDVTFPEVEGIYCIDSAVFFPRGPWLAADISLNEIVPDLVGGTGDTLVGGVSPTAFCVTVTSSCCDVPGDADRSGAVNIADATFLVTRLFAGGIAPPCPQGADANGDGRVNIADITYLIKRIFAGGPAPVCGS